MKGVVPMEKAVLLDLILNIKTSLINSGYTILLMAQKVGMMTRTTKSLFIQFRIKKSVYKIAKKQIK